MEVLGLPDLDLYNDKYKKLIKFRGLGYKQDDIADKLDVAQTWVSTNLMLLRKKYEEEKFEVEIRIIVSEGGEN